MNEVLLNTGFGYYVHANLVFADNGVSFPVEQLDISPNGDYYQNRASQERYEVIGSCQVDLDSIGKGVHYLLKDDNGKVYLLNAEGFEKNFDKL